MKTCKPNIILSILVLIVSFLSILVIDRHVLAAWYYPQATPPDTILDNHFVFNPATEDFNLNGHSLCLSGVCHNMWPPNSGGSGLDWKINTNADNALYYTTSTSASVSGFVGIGTSTPGGQFSIVNPTPNRGTIEIHNPNYTDNDIQFDGGTDSLFAFWNYGSSPNGATFFRSTAADPILYLKNDGRIGIATSTPNKLLHLYKTSGDNAELDIQSVAGVNNHWGIYQDRTTEDLRFWQGSDLVTFSDIGEVAIGGEPDGSTLLATTSDKIIAIKAQNNNTWMGIGLEARAKNYGIRSYGDSAGVYGESSIYGVSGQGVGGASVGVYGSSPKYGVQGNSTGGASGVGVYGSSPKYGVQGNSTGATGAGIYGTATQSGGTGVYGVQGAGTYAAKFDGLVYFNNGSVRFSGSNIYLPNGSGKPLDAIPPILCEAIIGNGKIYIDSTGGVLYVCTSGGIWKSVTLN